MPVQKKRELLVRFSFRPNLSLFFKFEDDEDEAVIKISKPMNSSSWNFNEKLYEDAIKEKKEQRDFTLISS